MNDRFGPLVVAGVLLAALLVWVAAPRSSDPGIEPTDHHDRGAKDRGAKREKAERDSRKPEAPAAHRRPARPRGTAMTEQPDVFVVAFTGANADYFGTYGDAHAVPTTPTLDRLAESALVFEAATAPFSRDGSPSVVIGGPTIFQVETPEGRSKTTLGGLIAGAGYECVGALGAELPDRDALGCERVADLSGTPGQTGASNPYDVTQTALDLVDSAPAGRPVFAYIQYLQPLPPYTPPESILGRYDPAPVPWVLLQSTLRAGGDETARAHLELAYRASVHWADRAVAYLFDGLAKRNRMREAVVVVTALGGDPDMAPEQKGAGKARIPLVIKFPGSWNVGARRVRDEVGPEDVLPTVLEVMGIEPPPGLAGDSLMPTAYSGEGQRPGRARRGDSPPEAEPTEQDAHSTPEGTP